MADPINFICNLQYEEIPENARSSARLCILDAVGCMLGGIQNKAVLNLARTISGTKPGASQIAGTSLSSTRPWAAFVNSHSCSYFDLDDGHRKAQGHPGGIIVPLSLMIAAENNLTGKDLIAAVTAGYETAVRSALIIREAGGPRKGSGGWSILGAVAAAAKLSGLSKTQLCNSLGLAEYYAPQAPQDKSLAYPSSMKEGMAWAGHAAISITDLAEMNFDGMLPSLATSKHCSDLGNVWEICSTYYKMYACCRFSHPVLDGLASLFPQKMTPDEIKSITVSSFAKAMLLNHLNPENPVAAMYSIPFIIGCFLVNGKIGPSEITEKCLVDENILKLAKKVVLEEDLEITAQFPLKCLARVSVTLKDDTLLKSDTLSAKGDPDNPYSETEMIEKFMEQTKMLPDNGGEKLCKEILHIENESPKKIWESLNFGTQA